MTRQTQIWSTREGGLGTDDSSDPDLEYSRGGSRY